MPKSFRRIYKIIAMRFLFVLLLLISSLENSITQQRSFNPSKKWLDTDGNPIKAHGGGVIFHEDTYYLYGEIKKGETWLVPDQEWECYRVPAGGISCYSSKDLMNWKYESVALSTTVGDPSSDIDTSKVVERPKVLFNKKSGKFVMWMHIDERTYSYAHAGVAVSDSPVGPYLYLGSMKPNGNDSRDMTLFQDDDGKAYHIYSSEKNMTMRVCQLSDDYLTHTKNERRMLIDRHREAPSMFKNNGKYYLITSGCTGWSPNSPLLSVSNHPLGTWQERGNPCIGEGAETTFMSQSTFVVPVPGKKNAYIFMADRWNKEDLEQSSYIWLPLQVKNGKPEITWHDQWNLNVF
jgi:beta-xylosidase